MEYTEKTIKNKFEKLAKEFGITYYVVQDFCEKSDKFNITADRAYILSFGDWEIRTFAWNNEKTTTEIIARNTKAKLKYAIPTLKNLHNFLMEELRGIVNYT